MKGLASARSAFHKSLAIERDLGVALNSPSGIGNLADTDCSAALVAVRKMIAFLTFAILSACSQAPVHTGLCEMAIDFAGWDGSTVRVFGVASGAMHHGWSVVDEHCWRGIPLALNSQAKNASALQSALGLSGTGIVRVAVTGKIVRQGEEKALLVQSVEHATFIPVSYADERQFWADAAATRHRQIVR